MDKGISVLVCLTCLICGLVLVTSKQCVKQDNCRCEFDDGSGVLDLTALGHTDGTALFLDHPATGDSFWYSYNPCGSFNDVTCMNVAACQYDPVNYVFYDIGVPNTVIFGYDGQNVEAQYQSFDGARKTFVKMVCDESALAPSLDVVGEIETTQYHMTLTAKEACVIPSPGSGGLSGGSVILIVFFVLLFVYLAVGMTFNRIRRDAGGLELVPNFSFWTKLPGLIKDGCAYSMAVVCRKKTVYVSM